MIIDSIRLENIKLAVSMIGNSPDACKEFEVNQIKFWADQLLRLAEEI